MNRIQTSSAPNLSPPQRPNKVKAHVLSSPANSTDDDNPDMPVLTPEVPLGSGEGPMGPPLLKPECVPVIEKVIPTEVNYSTPPILKPIVFPSPDEDLKLKLSNGEKPKKRKSKTMDTNGGPLGLSEFSSDQILPNEVKIKKLKSSSKCSEKKPKFFGKPVNRCKKFNKNILLNKSDRVVSDWEESSKKLLKVLNQKTKPTARFGFESLSDINMSNVWSVDSNHTLSSMNGSVKTSQPFVKYGNFDESNGFGMDCAQSESLLAHNSSVFDNSFKIRQKLIKKSKTALNNQSLRVEANRSPKKSQFTELIGVQKPTPEVDLIEGISFQSFEKEEDINLFSKFEQYEKEQKEQSALPKTFKIKSLKSGKMITPTKTKDITKIKGWREKLLPSLEDKQKTQRFFTLSNTPEPSPNKNNYNSFISDSIIGQTSNQKSAFVSDQLDRYLKTKSPLKLNYLSPDLEPPPDDSPIFSASVLRMPDISSPSMPPPSTPSSLQSKPLKRKFFKTKGIKNKDDSLINVCKPPEVDNDVPFSETLLPQYPVIRETLWPDMPQSDDMMRELYNAYKDFAHEEAQQMKRSSNPSVTMDDNYARFALSALRQCNEKTSFDLNESTQNTDDVLMAVGLAPKLKSPTKSPKSPSPVKDTKIGRPKKDREADLAKIFAMGNRSKRQIRLPSRFHESSLLMGNQWIIPDYDQKGKTGKRRLQDEQKRLQELHQRQLEMEQRKPSPILTIEPNTSTDEQLSLIHKNLPNGTKSPIKSKPNTNNIPTVHSDYPIKIPQVMRDQKKNLKTKNESQKMEKGFTSLYSMSTQTPDNKRVLSLSAKAAASATQRAVVNQLFLELSETIHTDKNYMICRNGKLNKLETIKDAIETINKLSKRDQQLSYIRKLLSMWNHKLLLCHKVSQKDLKPEAIKVVADVMGTYRDSMCYKVGEALEAKRKEFQEKRAKQISQQTPSQSSAPTKKPQLFTGSQFITIPNTKPAANTFKMPTKTLKSPKGANQRPILPKLELKHKSKAETVTLNTSGYPKLTTPDLHQKRVIDASVDEVSREGSLLKPPILTTRPTVLKLDLMVPSAETSIYKSTSVTGPIINVPDIAKYKSMGKMSSSSQSLIAHKSSTPMNGNSSRLKLPFNSLNVPTTVVSNTPNSTISSSSQTKGSSLYSPHSYAGKNVIITSETPLGDKDLTRIVASITANPDTFKKVPVRLSNGMAAALTIPGSTTVTASKSSTTGSGSVPSTHTITIGSTPRSRGNSSEFKEESKLHKSPKSSSQTSISSLNLSQTHGMKANNKSKAEKGMAFKSDTSPYDCIEID